MPKKPACSCTFELENVKLFQESVSKVPPLGIRILPHLEKSEINLNLIDDASSVDIAQWTLSVPTVRFNQIKKRYNQPGNIQTVLFATYFRISFIGFFFSQMVLKHVMV